MMLCAITLGGKAQTAVLSVDASREGVTISPTLYGLFYEEINHAGEGAVAAPTLITATPPESFASLS